MCGIKRFENYDPSMITWNNARYSPTKENILTCINDGDANRIDWDDKTSGSIMFDFK